MSGKKVVAHVQAAISSAAQPKAPASPPATSAHVQNAIGLAAQPKAPIDTAAAAHVRAAIAISQAAQRSTAMTARASTADTRQESPPPEPPQFGNASLHARTGSRREAVQPMFVKTIKTVFRGSRRYYSSGAGGGGGKPPWKPGKDLPKGHYIDYNKYKTPKTKKKVDFHRWTWLSGEETKQRTGDRWDALELFASCPEGSVGWLHYHGLASLMVHIGALHSADIGNFFAQHRDLLNEPVTLDALRRITALETMYWDREWLENRSFAGLLGYIASQQFRLNRLLNTYRDLYGEDPPQK